jgi:hypothetical protein
MTTQPPSPNQCDPTAQLQRQELLEQLYVASGRNRKSHPLYSLYTGLYQEWTQQQQQQEPQ